MQGVQPMDVERGFSFFLSFFLFLSFFFLFFLYYYYFVGCFVSLMVLSFLSFFSPLPHLHSFFQIHSIGTLVSSFHTSYAPMDTSIFDDAFKDLEDLDKKEDKKTKKTTTSDEGEEISTSGEQKKSTKATAKNPSVRTSFKKMNRVGLTLLHFFLPLPSLFHPTIFLPPFSPPFPPPSPKLTPLLPLLPSSFSPKAKLVRGVSYREAVAQLTFCDS